MKFSSTLLSTIAILAGSTNSLIAGCENYVQAHDNCGTSGVAVSFNLSPAITLGEVNVLLNSLKSSGIKPATFFLNPGANNLGPAMLVQQCQIAKAIIADKHEVQCGSYSGRPASTMTDAQYQQDLIKFNSWLSACANTKATVVLGADGMKKSEAQIANGLGMDVALWNLDPRDYAQLNAAALQKSLNAEITRYATTYREQRPSTVVIFSDKTARDAKNSISAIAGDLKSLGPFVTQSSCKTTCTARADGMCPDISEPNYILNTWKSATPNFEDMSAKCGVIDNSTIGPDPKNDDGQSTAPVNVDKSSAASTFALSAFVFALVAFFM
jgi:hypothetical protein